MLRAQPRQRQREQAAGGRGERRDPQLPPATLTALRLQIGLGQFHLGQDAGRMVGQQPAGVGEAHAAAVLREELLADLALQLRHLL
ncbi:hypothetical protein GCM10020256_66450 [Streptomyces thermocoprophilus]